MTPGIEKAQPSRMCVACRGRSAKAELLRFVRTSAGEVVFDPQARLFGRSAYLCRTLTCVEQARRKRLLERHLRSNVGEGIWQELEGLGE